MSNEPRATCMTCPHPAHVGWCPERPHGDPCSCRVRPMTTQSHDTDPLAALRADVREMSDRVPALWWQPACYGGPYESAQLELRALFDRIEAALASEGGLDEERLYRAIVDELVVLWGEPSDGISTQIRPIVARSIADRYARLAAPRWPTAAPSVTTGTSERPDEPA